MFSRATTRQPRVSVPGGMQPSWHHREGRNRPAFCRLAQSVTNHCIDRSFMTELSVFNKSCDRHLLHRSSSDDRHRKNEKRAGELRLMLLGHIDLVDRHTVRGWAADTDRPYGTLEVAVFVDGKLAGLTRADQARDELKGSIGGPRRGCAWRRLSVRSSPRRAAGPRCRGSFRRGRQAAWPVARDA